MSSERVQLDGKKRKLVLHGSCLELGPVCSAVCCRTFRVPLSSEEYASGLYQAHQTCLLTDKACDGKAAACINRVYYLEKDAAGVCVYLGDSNLCTIYQDRPKVCQDFSCQGGWRLGTVFPVEDDGPTSPVKLEKNTFVEHVTGDMTFVSHPLIKVHAVFYARRKGEITFLKEKVGTCDKFYTRDSFQYSQLNDELLLRLIRLFDSKDTLQEIRQRFCEQHAVSLTTEEFYDIVWLLNKHNIVLEARNFRGMLAGMGGI